jgi:hypothetical protein
MIKPNIKRTKTRRKKIQTLKQQIIKKTGNDSSKAPKAVTKIKQQIKTI